MRNGAGPSGPRRFLLRLGAPIGVEPAKDALPVIGVLPGRSGDAGEAVVPYGDARAARDRLEAIGDLGDPPSEFRRVSVVPPRENDSPRGVDLEHRAAHRVRLSAGLAPDRGPDAAGAQ